MKHQSLIPIVIPPEAASHIPPGELRRFLALFDLRLEPDPRGNAAIVLPPLTRRPR